MTETVAIKSKIKLALENLSQEAKELYLGNQIPTINFVPEPLQFYRDYVSQNRPVIIKQGVGHWPALHKWTNKYLEDQLGELQVTVTATPNGYADAPDGDYFMMPEERQMSMSQFIRCIENPTKDEVLYIQKQNSNLIDEFKSIIDDVDSEISWASLAFNKNPDAVNFWMGDERAITSMHKDPYENIYCVVRGHKDIILQPPTDLPWIPYKELTPGVYRRSEDVWKKDIDEDSDKVSWIVIDPINPDLEQHPDYRNSSIFRLRLEQGDCLYLPSFWFHHLSQSQGCIAVNYWYDMEFDIKYNYYNLLHNLKKTIL